MTNIKKQGQIQISDDVLAIIAHTAALEVDGVASSQTFSGKSRLATKRGNKIKIQSADGRVVASISIVVKFGYKIHQVAANVQKKVKYALENMAGVAIKEIQVNVIGIKITQPSKKAQSKKR